MTRLIPAAALISTLSLLSACSPELPLDEDGYAKSSQDYSPDCEKCSSSTITLSGKVYVFQVRSFLPYATITIEEYPSFVAVTDANGDWSISGLPANKKLTPKVSFNNDLYASFGLPAFQDMHQQTFKSKSDIDMLYFQAVPQASVAGLAYLAGVALDPAACQVVTTITDPAMDQVTTWAEFDAFQPHGLADMTAQLKGDGVVPSPVYFNDSVLPDTTLTASSGDGGVLWANVEAGHTYKIKTKDPAGTYSFDKIRVDCQAGRLINASPPWGATAY